MQGGHSDGFEHSKVLLQTRKRQRVGFELGLKILSNGCLVVVGCRNIQALNDEDGGGVQLKLRFHLLPQVLPLLIGQ